MQLMKIDLITIIMRFIYFVTAKETMEQPNFKSFDFRLFQINFAELNFT